MSLPRFRNKYTLVNKRQPRVDPFETDPFKIHSFNFRYAERPLFPMKNLQQRINHTETLGDCGTYFYNQGFSTTNKLNEARTAGDKRVSSLQRFQEYRKRKFLNHTAPGRISYLPQIKQNSAILHNESYTSKLLNSYKTSGNVIVTESSSKPNCYTTLSSLANLSNSFSRNKTPTECSKRFPLGQKATQDRFPSSSGTILNSQSKTNSGCDINININGLQKKSLQENVNIKIETDSIYKNLNIPFANTSKHSPKRLDRYDQLRSSDSFTLNKRLCKFSTNENKENFVKKSEKERNQELTSLYSSSKFSKTSRAILNKSTERLPSLIPFKTNEFKRNGSELLKQHPTSQKSFIQRVGDSLSVYDNKASSTKSSLMNDLSRKYKNTNLREIKTSRLFSKPSLQFSSSKRKDSKMRSNARLPLNININVFGANLKLLKV